MDSFSCILFLQQVHLCIYMYYVLFDHVMLKYPYFGQEMLGSAPLYDIDVKTFGSKLCQNMRFPCTCQPRRNSFRVCNNCSCFVCHLGQVMRKCVLCHMRTTKAQINLRIRFKNSVGSPETKTRAAVMTLQSCNNIKPACHKIYQGRYYLLNFSFLIFIFCCNPLDAEQTLSVY